MVKHATFKHPLRTTRIHSGGGRSPAETFNSKPRTGGLRNYKEYFAEDFSSRIVSKLVAKYELPTAENFILIKKKLI